MKPISLPFTDEFSYYYPGDTYVKLDGDFSLQNLKDFVKFMEQSIEEHKDEK